MSLKGRTTWDPRRTLGLFLVSSLVAFWVYTLTLKPGKQRLHAMSEDLRELQGRHSIHSDGGMPDQTTQRTRTSLETEWSESVRRLTRREEKESLLPRIDRLARQSGLELFSLKPGKITPDPDWSEWSVEVEGAGNFRSLRTFLADMPRLESLIATRSLEVGPLRRDSARHSIRVTLTLGIALLGKESS